MDRNWGKEVPARLNFMGICGKTILNKTVKSMLASDGRARPTFDGRNVSDDRSNR